MTPWTFVLSSQTSRRVAASAPVVLATVALASLGACGPAVDPDGVPQQARAEGASGSESEARTTTVHIEVRTAPVVAQGPVVVVQPVAVYTPPAYVPRAPTYVHTSYTPADDGSTILYVRPARVDPPPPVIYAPMRLPPRPVPVIIEQVRPDQD